VETVDVADLVDLDIIEEMLDLATIILIVDVAAESNAAVDVAKL